MRKGAQIDLYPFTGTDRIVRMYLLKKKQVKPFHTRIVLIITDLARQIRSILLIIQ